MVFNFKTLNVFKYYAANSCKTKSSCTAAVMLGFVVDEASPVDRECFKTAGILMTVAVAEV